MRKKKPWIAYILAASIQVSLFAGIPVAAIEFEEETTIDLAVSDEIIEIIPEEAESDTITEQSPEEASLADITEQISEEAEIEAEEISISEEPETIDISDNYPKESEEIFIEEKTAAADTLYGIWSNFKYEENSSGGITITRYTGAETNVTIPETINGKYVTSIGDYAFGNCKSLCNIKIPDSVTSIGEEAFYNCISLNNLDIPDSVKSIGDSAFYGCNSLIFLVVPNNIENIYNLQNEGFICKKNESGNIVIVSYCGGKTTVEIPSTIMGRKVTEIDECTFELNISLSTVKIPNSITNIKWNAFASSNLTNITIPNSITCIEEGVFSECSFLKTISLPNSLTSIENLAFYHCISLNSIKLPEGLNSIESNAFTGCTSLSSITIPSTVTRIGWGAFDGCSSLTSVTIPSTVTEIEDYAFGWETDESTEEITRYSNFVIYGKIGSAAEAYAKRNNIPFLDMYSKPSAPKSVSAENYDSGINLKWTAVKGANGYLIYRKSTDYGWKLVKKLEGENITSYLNSAVKSSNGKSYKYCVKAYRAGVIGASSYVTIDRLTQEKIVSITNPRKKAMTVKWSKNSMASGYQICCKNSSTKKYYTIEGSGTLSKTITNLPAGSYYVYVRSYRRNGGKTYYSKWSQRKLGKVAK